MAAAVKSPKKSKTPPAKSPPPKTNKGAGRPKKPFVQRFPKAFKTAATGETRNSPMTDPNIIFWLGMGLIIFSGWSNGRIQNIFAVAWGNGGSPSEWLTNLKVTASQFLFLFILVISGRAVPPLARIWLVMVGGLWILYLMKNPQVLKLLNWTSVGATTQSQYNSIISQIGATFGQAAAFRETTATNTPTPVFGTTNQPTPVTTAKSGAQ